jgi:hypothetical protein
LSESEGAQEKEVSHEEVHADIILENNLEVREETNRIERT